MQNDKPSLGNFRSAHDAHPVRPLAAADWQALKGWAQYIAKVHGAGDQAAAHIEAQPQHLWQGELSRTDLKFFGAFDEGRIVALARVYCPAFPNPCEMQLEVAADWQRSGIGSGMYGAVKDFIAARCPGQPLIAQIRAENTASRALAEKAGLRITGSFKSAQGQPYVAYSITPAIPASDLSIPRRAVS